MARTNSLRRDYLALKGRAPQVCADGGQLARPDSPNRLIEFHGRRECLFGADGDDFVNQLLPRF